MRTRLINSSLTNNRCKIMVCTLRSTVSHGIAFIELMNIYMISLMLHINQINCKTTGTLIMPAVAVSLWHDDIRILKTKQQPFQSCDTTVGDAIEKFLMFGSHIKSLKSRWIFDTRRHKQTVTGQWKHLLIMCSVISRSWEFFLVAIPGQSVLSVYQSSAAAILLKSSREGHAQMNRPHLLSCDTMTERRYQHMLVLHLYRGNIGYKNIIKTTIQQGIVCGKHIAWPTLLLAIPIQGFTFIHEHTVFIKLAEIINTLT